MSVADQTRRLHRTHWLIAHPLLTILCRLRGHDLCDDTCCVDSQGNRFCWRCLRWNAA